MSHYNNKQKKPLLIISVYGPSEYNQHWYALQKNFLAKTTAIPYTFKIIANNSDSDLFDADELLIKNDKNIGHPAGLEQAFHYMREQQDHYSGYLILDSDAFPVRAGWHHILDRQMDQFNKTIAAPIRYENLDKFPHPCVVYLNKTGLQNEKVNFNYAKVENLLGDMINEVGGLMPDISSEVLPLLRTNRVNLHPIAAGIYHHLFYHHGAGSRGFDFRLLLMYEYYNHWIDNNKQAEYGEQLMEALVSNPDGFIDKLMCAY